jgi:hypothetical protein
MNVRGAIDCLSGWHSVATPSSIASCSEGLSGIGRRGGTECRPYSEIKSKGDPGEAGVPPKLAPLSPPIAHVNSSFIAPLCLLLQLLKAAQDCIR